MDKKFQRPNKATLTNAQYYSFISAFGEQLTAATFTVPAIQTRQTALVQQTALTQQTRWWTST